MSDSLLQEFAEEAIDLLGDAENSLLEMEKTRFNEEAYNSIFRAFHSLKGSSGMMGLSDIQKHMHLCEDYFQNLKETPDELIAQIDYFLDSVDHTRKLLNGETVQFTYSSSQQKIKAEEKKSAETKSSSPASQEELKQLDRIPCDIYIALSNTKFKKLIHQNSAPESLDLEVMKKNKIDQLYIKASDYFYFESAIYSDEDKQSHLEQIKVKEDDRDNLREILIDLGYSKITINKFFDYIDNLVNSEKEVDIQKLLKGIDDSVGSFLFNHSFLTVVTGLTYLKKQSWTNSENERKYIKAAMMHDAGYGKPEYAWYESSLSKLDKESDLAEEIKYELKHHDEIIMEKLKNLGEHDDDVVKIIQCHHLSKEQVNTTPATTFTRLASVFYLSHKLTIELYRQAFSPKKRGEAFEKIENLFKNGPYGKIGDDFCRELKEVLL